MKASIITVSLNSLEGIEDCIKSVLNQTYKDIEYLIIDGGSTDGTIEIIKKYRKKIAFWMSEKDKGIYDAMNRGIKIASGEIIGIINSDDTYADNFVIEDVVEFFLEKNVDSCYGDLLYVDKKDPDKIIRIWKSGDYSKAKFKRGWMPPHPTFFVRKEIYEKYGYFNLDFPIVSDYELMLRFLYKYNISTAYLNKVLVKMRTGGESRSDLLNVIRNSISCYRAWKANGLRPNIITFFLKPLLKTNQYLKFIK